MNNAEIAFSLFDDNRDGYVTSKEMMKRSKNLTADQVDKVSCQFLIEVGWIQKLFVRFLRNLILMETGD